MTDVGAVNRAGFSAQEPLQGGAADQRAKGASSKVKKKRSKRAMPKAQRSESRLQKSQPAAAEIQAQIERLEDENKRLRQKLEMLRKAAAPMTKVIKPNTTFNVPRPRELPVIVPKKEKAKPAVDLGPYLAEIAALKAKLEAEKKRFEDMEARFLVKIDGLTGELTDKRARASEMSVDINRLTALVRSLQEHGNSSDDLKKQLESLAEANIELAKLLQKEREKTKRLTLSMAELLSQTQALEVSLEQRILLMRAEVVADMKKEMMKQLAKHADSLSDKARDLSTSLKLEFEGKNRAMKQAWDSREKQFRELWDGREADFNRLMKEVGSVTKVKMTREVRVKALEGDEAKQFKRSEREATLADFPEMMEEVQGIMKTWKKSPSDRLGRLPSGGF